MASVSAHLHRYPEPEFTTWHACNANPEPLSNCIAVLNEAVIADGISAQCCDCIYLSSSMHCAQQTALIVSATPERSPFELEFLSFCLWHGLICKHSLICKYAMHMQCLSLESILFERKPSLLSRLAIRLKLPAPTA